MARRLIPLLDRVLVEKVVPTSFKTPGGILLPESAKKAQEGVVIAVGSGRLTADGKVLPLNVKEGDKVLLPEYGGTKVDMGAKDVEHALFREDELLGIIKD